MHTARPVGLSQDGRSLIVTTPDGEELAVPVDDRLHAALRGDQPRLGQLEIEMENALGPRDIQARIRAGHSLEEVGRVAGLPMDRVERFAAPVLAERDHVALLAMSSSVRRRGETSGHRLLQATVGERLGRRGIDLNTVDWNSFRMDDGRWSVSASYRSGEAVREAVFTFDLRARFSVPANDEARWAVGEQSSLKGPQPGRRRPSGPDGEVEGADVEPTLDLSDELALIRAIQPDTPLRDLDREDSTSEPSPAPHPAAERGAPSAPAGPEGGGSEDERETRPEAPVAEEPAGGRVATVRTLYPVPDRSAEPPADEDVPANDEEETAPGRGAQTAPAGRTAPSGRGGSSDASAVPVTGLGGWEPGIVVDYPVEPIPDDEDDATEAASDRATTDEAVTGAGAETAAAPTYEGPPDGPVSHATVFTDRRSTWARTEVDERLARVEDAGATRATEIPAPADPIVDGDDRREEAEELEKEQAAQDAAAPAPAVPAPAASGPAAPESESEAPATAAPAAKTPAPKSPAGKRKRAAVPSWDEIMFGGPPRSS